MAVSPPIPKLHAPLPSAHPLHPEGVFSSQDVVYQRWCRRTCLMLWDLHFKQGLAFANTPHKTQLGRPSQYVDGHIYTLPGGTRQVWKQAIPEEALRVISPGKNSPGWLNIISFREIGESGSCFSRRITSPSRMNGKIMATCMHSMLITCLTHSPLSQPSLPTQKSFVAICALALTLPLHCCSSEGQPFQCHARHYHQHLQP